MNKTLKLLMLSDIFLLTGFGLISPILAIFIKDNLVGGTILNAGIASAIFYIIKATVQIPFSRYTDNHKKRKKWLLIGTFLIVTVPFIYIFSNNISTIFLAQIIYGIGSGMAAASWLTIWGRHLDKNHEGFEWSVYSASIGVGTASAAFAGGLIAQLAGFVYAFLFTGVLSIIGFLILINLDTADEERKAEKTMHYHRRRKIHPDNQ